MPNPEIPVHQHDVGRCRCGAEAWLYSFAEDGERLCGPCIMQAAWVGR